MDDDEEDDRTSILKIPQYIVDNIKNIEEVHDNIQQINAFNDKYDNKLINSVSFPSNDNNLNFGKIKDSDYRNIKYPLHKIIRHNDIYENINKLVYDIKQFKVCLPLFIRSHILYKVDNGHSIPIINDEYLSACINVLTIKDSRGPPIQCESKIDLIEELSDFYNKEFILNVPTFRKIKVVNCSQLLAFISTEIITNYNNSISVHFFEFLFKFVNSYVSYLFDTELEEIEIDTYKYTNKMYDEKNKDNIKSFARKIKMLFLQGDTDMIDVYLPQTQLIKDFILPRLKEGEKHYININKYPDQYLPYLINMNRILESIGKSTFQVMPLSKSLIPDHIKLDTRMLIDLFVKDKNKYFNDVNSNKYDIWNMFFDMSKKIFKDKGKGKDKGQYRYKFKFDYMINTDGYSTSLSFFKKGARKRTGKGIKYKDTDCPYIDELNIEQLNKIRKNSSSVYNDPGKKNIYYMANDSGKTLRYSSKQRSKELQKLTYKKFINDMQMKTVVNNKTVKKIESKLTECKSKTYDYEEFNKYIKCKLDIMYELSEFYQDVRFRKWRARAYINKQRSESKLTNKIIETYGIGGKDICIFIGNWSQPQQMRNFISTPGKGLRKNIEKLSNGRIKFIRIDEFRTSCLHYKTGEKLANKRVGIGKNAYELHSVLTRKGKNNVTECIHRDKNAIKNYRMLVKYYMRFYSRPLFFLRGLKVESLNNEDFKYLYNEMEFNKFDRKPSKKGNKLRVS